MTDSQNSFKDSYEQNFTRLARHCLNKGFQFGSVVACAVIAPAKIAWDRRKGAGFSISRVVSAQFYGVIFGVTVSMGMMMWKYWHWEDKEKNLFDRAYKLRNNVAQTRVDWISEIALGGSFLVGLAATRSVKQAVGWSTPCVCAGLLYHVISGAIEDRKQNE